MRLRKTLWAEYTIILIVTVISNFIRYSLWEKLGLKGEFPKISIVYTLLFLVFTWEFFLGMNRYLDKKIPFSKGLAARIGVQIALGAFYMLVVNRLLFLVAGQYLEGSLTVMFSMTTYATFTILSLLLNSIFIGKHFFDEWKKSLLRAERLEKEKTQVQFDNLKNQLNPHFLFNSLSSLHSLIFDQPALASEYVTNLSKVYRYVLQHENKTTVRLREELDFIGHFIFLLNTRFQGGIEILSQIPQDDLEKEIVPVTLQVLLENCIKHNALDPEKPLQITIISENEYLTVRNTLNPKKAVSTSNKQGLMHLQRLYAFLTPRPVNLVSDEHYFTVSVPLISTI